MTDQEKREKAIEEMESDICNGCKYYKGKDFCCICDVISYVKTLVDLHYRKEEEVQKETARKIFKKLKEANDAFKYEILSNEERKDITSDDFYYRIVLTSTFKELGFEVEE